MSPVSEGLIDAIEADPADYGTYDENRFNDGINDPFFVAGDGYTSGSRDNRASIRISSIDEGGCVTAVTIFNTGFDFAQEEFQATITSPNGCEAVLAFTTGAVLVKAGRFKDSRGMLSNINKLQDNYYYQNYSYVIKSGITSGSWLPIINKTVHPAGMAVFGELLITQTIDMVDYIGVLDVLVLNEFFVDVVLMNDQSRSVDFHKILTDIVAGTVTTYAVPDYVPIEYASMDADSLEVHFYKVLSDSVVLSDATELLFDVGIYDSEEDTTSTIDSFDRVVQYVRQFNEAFYTSHTTTVDFGKTVVEDPVWVTRDFWAEIDYSGTEFAWNAEETINVDFGKYLTDSYTSSDSINNFIFGKSVSDTTTTAHGRPGFVINKVLSETIFASDAKSIAIVYPLTDTASISEDSIITSLLNKTEIVTTLDYYNKVLQVSKIDDAETSEIIFIEDEIPHIDLVGVNESSRMIINKGIGDMLGITDSGIINIQDYVEGDFGSDFVGQATYF